MAGIKGKSGGKRPGSGPKPKAQKDELSGLLDVAWPKAERVKAIKAAAKLADNGDVKALTLLLAYGYGRPAETVTHKGDENSPIKVIVEYAGDTP